MHTRRTRLAWMPRRPDLVDYLAKELRTGDVCISMGCGDVASLPDEVHAAPGRAQGRVRLSLSERLHRAAADLGPRARLDEPLGPLTTYRVGGCAAMFVAPATRAELDEMATVITRYELPVLVIGRGSNLLVADRGFDGVVISLAALADGDRHRRNRGALPVPPSSLPVLARKTAAAGLTGFEWAVGVPGSIGGAVRMNAGGHGSDMAACLVAGRDLRRRRPAVRLAARRVSRPALPRLGPRATTRSS